MWDNGYTELPSGKIASVVTYLEMTRLPEATSTNPHASWTLRRHQAADLDWYRELFRTIGQDWLWFSRLQITDDALRAILHHPTVELYSLEVDGRDKGILELDRRHMPDVTLEFIGVTRDMVGQGAGRFLLDHAINLAKPHHPRSLLVHTCTLDHPRALAFYETAGFVPYRRAIEVADDPRLAGTLPITAAPQCPILKPGDERGMPGVGGRRPLHY